MSLSKMATFLQIWIAGLALAGWNIRQDHVRVSRCRLLHSQTLSIDASQYLLLTSCSATNTPTKELFGLKGDQCSYDFLHKKRLFFFVRISLRVLSVFNTGDMMALDINLSPSLKISSMYCIPFETCLKANSSFLIASHLALHIEFSHFASQCQAALLLE